MSKIEVINKMAKKQLEEIINDIENYNIMYISENPLNKQQLLDSVEDINKILDRIEEVMEVL